MSDPTPGPPNPFTEPLVEDRDAAFAGPLKHRVERERRKAVLVSFLWRTAVVAATGLGAVGIGAGAIHLTRLVSNVMSGG